MLESKIQSRLIKRLEKKGWYVIKLIQTNKNGIPDLLCIKDGWKIIFIEVKSKKGKVSELQKYRHKELKEKKIHTYIYYDP